jgi:hypothetical protein
MKITPISPSEAISRKDELLDVEEETVVARINCILAREFRGEKLKIPASCFGIGLKGMMVRFRVVQRFKDAGWHITHDEYKSERYCMPVYVFSQP